MSTQVEWRNRIVRSEWVEPGQLLAHPLNYRIHTDLQSRAVKASLDELGQYLPITVQDGTDIVIDGHLRVTLALRENRRILANYVDFDDAEANRALAIGDPITGLALLDRQKYTELLHETTTGEPALQELLANIAAENGVIPPNTFDPNAEWQGMPEFQQDDLMAAHRVVVNFKTTEDLEAFEQLINQSIPRGVRNAGSIWYPNVEPTHVSHLGYTSDES